MDENQHKIVQEQLLQMFNNVNNWLVFAEAKNAAIIAFNIACLTFICSVNWFDKFKICYLVFFGMLVSTIIALISFFPQTGKQTKNEGYNYNSDNLIFFNDIAKYGKEEYLKAVFRTYAQVNISNDEILKIENDLADAITCNAVITTKKYKLFKVALIIEILMLLLSSGMVIVLFCKDFIKILF